MSRATLAAEVLEAHQRTRAAGSAQLALLVQHAWDLPDLSSTTSRQKPLPWAMTKAAGLIGKGLLKAVTGGRDLRDLRQQTAAGFIDFARRRYQLDFGSYAQLYADQALWAGRYGRPLATLTPRSDATPNPLWLLDLLAGTDEADEVGVQQVYGTPCRHLTISANLARASQATPGGMASPKRQRFEDLLALRAEVWLDDTHIRRIRCLSEHRMETVQFPEFELPLDHLDWTRLPTFRPHEAARVNSRVRR